MSLRPELRRSPETASASEVGALESRLEALRALNAELEDRIADRTRELGAASSRLETLIEELPIGVVVVDSRGSLELANRPALQLMGLSREDLEAVLERHSWRMFGADGHELELSERPIVRALAGTATIGERFSLEQPDGTLVYLEISAVPTHDRDGQDSVVVTFQDVTKRERLERAERDFVTNAAHELQTPLAAIASAIEVLQAGAKERPEDRDRFLGHIGDACGRLDRLTRALLLLARAQIGEEARTEVIAVEPLLRSLAASVSLKREIRIECGGDVAVIANRALLEQALANLVENAVKHTRGSVVMAAQSEDRRVEIVVRDVGGGIADADRARVFERFYRGEGASQNGSGLGLAIVAAVARALGGELKLDSSPGGTSVAIVLPAARLVSR